MRTVYTIASADETKRRVLSTKAKNIFAFIRGLTTSSQLVENSNLYQALIHTDIFDPAKAGNETGAVSSMLKYYGTELNKRRAELAMSIAGSEGLKFDGQTQIHLAPVWLRTKANSIEGGTSQVQLNIIAKNVLRLPGA